MPRVNLPLGFVLCLDIRFHKVLAAGVDHARHLPVGASVHTL